MKELLSAAVSDCVRKLLEEAGLDAKDAPEVVFERPRREEHGDFATNIAMQLARLLRRAPREIAEEIRARTSWPKEVEAVEVAGPGFLNVRLKKGAMAASLRELLRPDWGTPDLGRGRSVCLEFVSANPTGPMHIGHGRGAVVGDALARILAACNWRVHREYYINDAGGQIETLAKSVWLRMRELAGEEIGPFPADAYPGEYVKEIAAAALQERPIEAWRAMPDEMRRSQLARFAVDWNMREIRADLDRLGIGFDRFVSEQKLHEEGAVQQAIEELQARGFVYRGTLPPPKGKQVEDYEPVEQLLFRATAFGDEVDRPLQKQDGSPTYFAADIAYHRNKLARGFDELINVWGADHGGYVRRLQAAVEALSGKKECPKVVLVQMVRVLRGGEPVRMSKRAGTFVTLAEVVAEVGADAVRFNFLTRRAESPLDFDLELAKQASDENPVYYAQYAHARICSILRRAEEAGLSTKEAEEKADPSRLAQPEEEALVARMLQWPDVLRASAERLEPHRVANWALDLAADFHAFYHRHRVVVEDRALALARLLLVLAVKQRLARALELLGVAAPERM